MIVVHFHSVAVGLFLFFSIVTLYLLDFINIVSSINFFYEPPSLGII